MVSATLLVEKFLKKSLGCILRFQFQFPLVFFEFSDNCQKNLPYFMEGQLFSSEFFAKKGSYISSFSYRVAVIK